MIFAAIGEELGFLGIVLVVCLFAAFVGEGFFIAQHATSDYVRLAATGLTALMGFQAFFIMAGVLRVFRSPASRCPSSPTVAVRCSRTTSSWRSSCEFRTRTAWIAVVARSSPLNSRNRNHFFGGFQQCGSYHLVNADPTGAALTHVRSLSLATVATALLVGVAILAVLPAEPAFAKTIPRCQETQLDVAIVSRGAAAGHVGDAIVLTNISSSTCTLSGYPTVRLSESPKAGLVLVAKDTLNGYLGGLGGTGAKLALPVVKLRAHGGSASSLVEGGDNPVAMPPRVSSSQGLRGASHTLIPPYRFSIKVPELRPTAGPPHRQGHRAVK